MSSTPIPVLVNPVAGRGRAAKCLPAISAKLQNGKLNCVVVESTAPGEIENQTFDAAKSGSARIIVAGGDGSIHEAVNGIMRAETDTALGVIPLGTGNDFAKACSIPLRWQNATRELTDRLSSNTPPRYIDVGRMNDRFFANGAGIGFDAKINRIAASIRWPIGDLIYLIAIFRGIRDGITTPTVRMQYADQSWSGEITLANISNGPWVGGMFHVAPMARNDDGFLDLVVVGPVGKRRVLSLLPSLMKGTHVHAPEVTCKPVRHFSLSADIPLHSHLDGEVQAMQSTFDIEIFAKSLALI